MNRLVAIVGQPNVGKSTLFNRLVAQPRAITAETAGVTRDRQYGMVFWNKSYCTLIDTGGYLDQEIDTWTQPIRQQIHAALAQAQLVLLVGDCKRGCTAIEMALAALLRQQPTPVLVVANKADNPRLANQAHELYALGLPGEVISVSAAHGIGTDKLLDAMMQHLPKAAAPPKTKLPQIAILGRPNTGKSSLLNLLLNEERSLVSTQAGTTRDALHVSFKRFGQALELVDTAGIRKSTKAQKDIEFYSILRSMRAMERCDVAWVLADAGLGVQRQDIHLLAEAQMLGKATVLVINKWDLIEKNTHTHAQWEQKLTRQLGDLAHIPRLYCSVHAKQRVLKLLDLSTTLYAQRRQRISTSKLNEWLQAQIAQHPPASVQNKILKLNYMTQTSASYPSFAVFGNRSTIPESYVRFLVNRLRKDFGWEGVAVHLSYKRK